MTAAVEQVSVMPAPTEELFSPEFQGVLGSVLRDLQAQGLKVAAQMRFHDATDTGGMWLLGQFTIESAKIASPTLIGIISAYLVARMGRKVKLKTGNIEVEAHSVEELQQLLKIADERERSSKESCEQMRDE